MVASTFYSEVKRLYVSLQESVGVRRKKQAVVISKPFNFRREPTALPGLTEDELSMLREKAAASRLGIAHHADPARAAAPTLFPSGPHRLLASRRPAGGPLTSSPSNPHLLGGGTPASSRSQSLLSLPRLEIPGNPPTPPRTPTPVAAGGTGPIPIPGAAARSNLVGAETVHSSSPVKRTGTPRAGAGGGRSGSPIKETPTLQLRLDTLPNDLEILLFGDPSGTGTIANTGAAVTVGLNTNTAGCEKETTKERASDLPPKLELIMPTVSTAGSSTIDFDPMVLPTSSISSSIVSPLEEAINDDCWNMDFDFQLGSPLSPRPAKACSDSGGCLI